MSTSLRSVDIIFLGLTIHYVYSTSIYICHLYNGTALHNNNESISIYTVIACGAPHRAGMAELIRCGTAWLCTSGCSKLHNDKL